MRPRAVTIHATRVLIVGAVVLLAACGSSDSGSDTSTKTSTSKTSADAGGASSTVVVKTADNSDLGTILVDAEGRTLYTLTSGGQAVACTGGCLDAWPPLLLPAGTDTATGTPDVEDLGTAPDGSNLQVTHAGLPLYRFAGDAAAGDANGEGISSFGGTWNVVKVGDTSSSSSSTTEKSSSPY